MQYSMDDLAGPAYPLAPGGRVPELNLAGADGLNVASGQSIQHTPDPVAPALRPLHLQGSPELGGIDPQTPIPVLNLAGVEGVPSPAQLMQAHPTEIHEPDFGLPDFTQPGLQTYDLTEPGFTQNPPFAPDPLLPDLDEYRQPYGLTIHHQSASEIFKPDPLLNDPLHYDMPEGIEIRRDAQDDPLLPDLQQATPAVPVQLADQDANTLHHMNPSYQALSDVPYEQVFMDQTGMNTSRRRHYDLLLSHYPDKS